MPNLQCLSLGVSAMYLRLAIRSLMSCVLPLFLVAANAQGSESPEALRHSDLISNYIDAWADFYPSEAFAYGRQESADDFEDFREDRVESWLALNREISAHAEQLLRDADSLSPGSKTDLSVLLAQTLDELGNWQEDAPLEQQPQWYAERVSQALTHLLVRDQLTAQQRSDAVVARLQGVEQLCRLAIRSLRGGNSMRTQRALGTLSGTREFYAQGLAELVADWPAARGELSLAAAVDRAVDAIAALEAYLKAEILPGATHSPAIGEALYAAKLARRSAGLSPARLLAAAGEELQRVRALMVDEAARWRASLPESQRGPYSGLSGDDLLAAAIAAMEAERQDNSADFLASFSELTFAAERFVEHHGIASIPRPTTLMVALSPAHFSGAAVGGVYPSGPFAPDADTLFYIPSIPDSAPAAAKAGFYRSFNTHFNTMILAHEMFPGHYLQYKVAVSQAPAVRALFPNGSYVEGWGSFVEELMLDAGWANNAPLTRLAHLRKRLENATRAYVSVQVNMAGWGESEVLTFAREEGLLAPQFATNLWQRVVNSPMQITDYFSGYRQFKALYDDYQLAARARSADPQTRVWVDAVLRAGPVPMALLEGEIQRGINSVSAGGLVYRDAGAASK
jgi:uncharacterized protein (DUF885 family)